MQKQLIVNADDLGMSQGINRGILEAHIEGIVSSSTAIVNLPASKAGIKLAQAEAPALGLGLHFNLTYGQPILKAREVPSLVRSNGDFVSLARGLSLYHHWRPKDIAAELSAQFERFTEYAGCLPDHLDSHQLVCSLSAECREVILDIAETYHLPVRQGGRYLYSRFEEQFASWGSLPKTIAPSLFKRYPLKRHSHIFDRDHPSPDHFEYGFHNTRATVTQLLDILENLPEGLTELVCHPGYPDIESDAYAHRELELNSLKDPQVKALIEAQHITLSTFAVLEDSSQDQKTLVSLGK
ncbi:MAG: ChbG/HpnK family deacetylase [Trueperaceae bacterium]|nr:ChbG/HpnK family deacetylase [Trueperaceae bacterium]